MQHASKHAAFSRCLVPQLGSIPSPAHLSVSWMVPTVIALCAENSQHVQHITVEDAEELYLSLTSRTNEGHVLMIVHAPWCPSCVGIEEQVCQDAKTLHALPLSWIHCLWQVQQKAQLPAQSSPHEHCRNNGAMACS